jgi:hypothetical protein
MSEHRIKLSPGQQHLLQRSAEARNEVNAAVAEAALRQAAVLEVARKHLAKLAADDDAVLKAVLAEASASGVVPANGTPVRREGDEIIITVEEKKDG